MDNPFQGIIEKQPDTAVLDLPPDSIEKNPFADISPEEVNPFSAVDKSEEGLLPLPKILRASTDKLLQQKNEFIQSRLKHVSGPPEFQEEMRRQFENQWNLGLNPIMNALGAMISPTLLLAGGEQAAFASIIRQSVKPIVTLASGLAGFTVADKLIHVNRSANTLIKLKLLPEDAAPWLQDAVNLGDFGLKAGAIGIIGGIPELYRQRADLKGFDFDAAAKAIEKQGVDKPPEVVKAAKDIVEELVKDHQGEALQAEKIRKPPSYNLKKAVERGDYRTIIRASNIAFPAELAKNFAPEEIKKIQFLFAQEGIPLDSKVSELKQQFPNLNIENDADLIRKAIDQTGKVLKKAESETKDSDWTKELENYKLQEEDRAKNPELYEPIQDQEIQINGIKEDIARATPIENVEKFKELETNLNNAKELMKRGFDEKYIDKMPADTMQQIVDQKLNPEEVSILPSGELKVIKPGETLADIRKESGYIGDAQYKANLETNLKQYESIQNPTPEDLKYIKETKAKIIELSGNPLDVQPTMPTAPLRSNIEQTDIPAMTALKHGLSPEVQKVMFDNAADAETKLFKQEKAGRVLIPVVKSAESEIQDPALRGALYAGRKKVSYLGSQFADWIKESAKSIWEGIEVEYEPTLAKFPQLKDDLRTGIVTLGRKGREQGELALGGIFGNLNNFKEDQVLNIIGIQKFLSEKMKGLEVARGLTEETLQKGLAEALKNASPETISAVEKYHKLMTAIAQDLINREKLSPDELTTNYFPSIVLKYLPEWWDDSAAFLPKRLREPYGAYLKKKIGSKNDVAISKEALLWHVTSVLMDNAIDDWAVEQLGKYDKFGLSEEQLKNLGPIKPDQPITIGDRKFKGFQYKPGRQVYPAQMTNPSVLNKALEGDLSAQDWLASIGPKGGAAVRQGAVLGRYNKVYLLPVEIYDRFAKLKAPYVDNPFLQIAMPATRMWKRVTLDFAGIPFQVNNFYGDFENLWRTAPGAAMEMSTSLRILKNLRHPDTLSPWEQHVLKVAQDKDVLGAGFVQEYAHISPGMTPKGILERLERLSSLREGILRLAMLSFQMKRTEVGLPIVAPEFKANIQGLDKLSSAAYVARNFTVDYLAIPDFYKQYVRGFAAPFITFYHLNAKNWAKYIKNDPTGYVAKFIIPRVGLWYYNNTEDRKKVEERLPDYWRFRPPHVILKTEDLNKDGIPDKALIWSMQTPSDMAISLIGLDRLGDKVTQIRQGKMTAKDAALQQLADLGLGTPRTVGNLLNPMIQFIQGVSSNRDMRTNQPVVPTELADVRDSIKVKYWARYFVEKMLTPFGQYLKDQRGTENTNLLISGPLDVMRALGFYEVNLSNTDAKVQMDKNRRARGDYANYMYKIEQRYLEGKDFSDIIRDAALNGITLSDKNIYGRIGSTNVQIDKIKGQMREAKDPLLRRRLELELMGLTQQRVEENRKTVPKGAR